MAMIVFNDLYYLGGDYIKTKNLPDDTMVMPIQTGFYVPEDITTMVCHSDKAEKWYILVKLDEPVPEYPEVFYYLYCSGTWVDIAPYCCLGYIYAPFKWGIPLPSKYSNGLQYIPVWESVKTGKYDDEGCPLYEEHYKLVSMIWLPNEMDNVTQYNEHTHFDITDFGTDLVDLVKTIECYTGIKY